MATDRVQLQDWVQLIRAEYEEFPDLRLTRRQVEESWKTSSATRRKSEIETSSSPEFIRCPDPSRVIVAKISRRRV